MRAENPYSPPAEDGVAQRPRFSVESLPLVLEPPWTVLAIAAVFALLCAVVAAVSVFHVVFLGNGAVSAVAIAILFGFCSYAALTAFFTSVTIDRSGVRMRGLYKYSYEWTGIKSWQQDEFSGLVTFVGHDGNSVMVSNFAIMSKSRSIEIGRAFSHFLGSQLDTNAGSEP